MIRLIDATDDGRDELRPTPDLDAQLARLGFSEIGLLRARPDLGAGMVVAVWASPRGDAVAIPEKNPRDRTHQLLYFRSLLHDGSLVDTSDERVVAPGYPTVRGRIRETSVGARWFAQHRPGASAAELWTLHQASVSARQSPPADLRTMEAAMVLSHHGGRLANRVMNGGLVGAVSLLLGLGALVIVTLGPLSVPMRVGLVVALGLAFPWAVRVGMVATRWLPRAAWPKAEVSRRR